MRLAMEAAGLHESLFSVCDGKEAVDYLDGNGKYSDRCVYPIPDLLLLDLKMPLMDGFEVLAWLQMRPRFNGIARVVLSSSNLESDVSRAKSLGAHDYRVKPNSYDDLVAVVRELHERWLSANFK
jgi:CheY-like chemotaxis protein